MNTEIKCEKCEKILDLSDPECYYDYDDDTGFYTCDNCCDQECYGKHCSNTSGLKLGKCWNRYEQKVTEELICEKCYEDMTYAMCVACLDPYPYDQVELKPQRWPWGSHLRGNDNFYCQDCIKDIKTKVENGLYQDY